MRALLEHLRAVHNLALGVSAVLITLSLLPDRAAKLERYGAELNKLRAFDSDIAATVGESFGDSLLFVRARRIDTLARVLESGLSGSRLAGRLEGFGLGGLYKTWEPDNSLAIENLTTVEGSVELATTLLVRFVSLPEPNALLAGIDRLLPARCRPCSVAGWSTLDLPMGRMTVVLSLLPTASDSSHRYQQPLTMTIDSVPADVLIDYFDVQAIQDLGYGTRHFKMANGMALRAIHSPLETLRDSLRFAVAVGDIENAPIWKEVRGLSVAAAQLEVQKRADDARTRVSFLGVTLDDTLVTLGGPAVVLILFAYLLCGTLQMGNSDLSKLKQPSPWMPLALGGPGRFAAWVTVGGIPSVAAIACLVRVWRTGNNAELGRSPQLSVAVAVAAVGISLATLRAVLSCQRRIHDPNPPE
jgi:hypothetical protein